MLLLARDLHSIASHEHMLKLFGANVIQVTSPAELIERLRSDRPDAIAVDLDAPEAGLHLIRRIRTRSRLDGGATPALAMTSALVPQLHTRALLAGFQGYVSGEPLELLLAVARVIEPRPETN